jgi:hypothetical protein
MLYQLRYPGTILTQIPSAADRRGFVLVCAKSEGEASLR